jgi:hypothetical protein
MKRAGQGETPSRLSNAPIHRLVADDRRIVREGLVELPKTDFDVVAAVGGQLSPRPAADRT